MPDLFAFYIFYVKIPTMTEKMTLEAGILVRGAVVSQLRDAAFIRDIRLGIDEDRGLLGSHYRITIDGSSNEVEKRFARDVLEWAAKNK